MVRQMRPLPPVPPQVDSVDLRNLRDNLRALHDWCVRAERHTNKMMLPDQRGQDATLLTKADTEHVHDTADVTTGSFLDARISQSSVTQHVGTIDHDSLLNHVDGQHRIINDAGTSATELWSASKIDGLVGGTATLDTQQGLTANVGGGEASATQLNAGFNEVSGVPSANDSSKLPTAVVGLLVIVRNSSANIMDLFPKNGTTAQINAAGADTAVEVAAGATKTLVCTSTTQWWMD